MYCKKTVRIQQHINLKCARAPIVDDLILNISLKFFYIFAKHLILYFACFVWYSLFSLRPVTHNVGDLIEQIRSEDRGIDRVVLKTIGELRITVSYVYIISKSCYTSARPATSVTYIYITCSTIVWCEYITVSSSSGCVRDYRSAYEHHNPTVLCACYIHDDDIAVIMCARFASAARHILEP